MSTARTRIRFQPCVLRGEPLADANALFAQQAARFNLVWTCADCAYQHPISAECTVGWPNDELRDAVEPVLKDDGIPVFCKAFEPE